MFLPFGVYSCCLFVLCTVVNSVLSIAVELAMRHHCYRFPSRLFPFWGDLFLMLKSD